MDADRPDPAAGVVWAAPWRPVTGEERRRLVVQLAQEVSTIHALSNHAPKVIGVRDGSDQILVRLRLGQLAVVSLEWTVGPGSRPDELPAVAVFDCVADFNAMGGEADEELALQRRRAA